MAAAENVTQLDRIEILNSRVTDIEKALSSYSDYFKIAFSETPGATNFLEATNPTPSQPVPPVPAINGEQQKLLEYIQATELYDLFNKLLNTDISTLASAQLVDFASMLSDCSQRFYTFVHRLYEVVNPAYDQLGEDDYFG